MYRIENEGDTPLLKNDVGAGFTTSFGTPNSGLWIVTTDTGLIETINGQCYYIVEGAGPHDITFI